MKKITMLLLLFLISDFVRASHAVIVPSSYQINGLRYETQGWNNCGPATLTMALSYFGYENNQQLAAQWLKPNSEDKNVSPWQMTEFVNTQLPDLSVQALARSGGTLHLLKELISSDFPVIIEEGYDPEPERLGWMGHYLLLHSYDDTQATFITHDSYSGPNLPYSYEHIEKFWQHFNYNYIVLYQSNQWEKLQEILGNNIDPNQNYVNALEIARAEALDNPQDTFAWFNMGTNYAALSMFEEATIAYDQARKLGIPWRMLWYQFSIYEAYNAVGRYEDTIELARMVLNDGGGQYVEETYYYAGVAREGFGEVNRALDNYNAAITFNPNFYPAREARDHLTDSQDN